MPSVMTRTRRHRLAFANPLRLKTLDQLLPPGEYEIITDEELIEGISFPVYRRVGTWIMAPTPNLSVELVGVDPVELKAGTEVAA